jgi:hypothetical protein
MAGVPRIEFRVYAADGTVYELVPSDDHVAIIETVWPLPAGFSRRLRDKTTWVKYREAAKHESTRRAVTIEGVRMRVHAPGTMPDPLGEALEEIRMLREALERCGQGHLA